jgi:hypothetical protein
VRQILVSHKMNNLYRQNKKTLDDILSDVLKNPAETEKLFEPIFDNQLEALEAQQAIESEEKLSPLLEETYESEEASVPYIEIQEIIKTRKRRKISRSLSDDQLKKLPKTLKLMVDTIYNPIFELEKEKIVSKILTNYNSDNEALLVGLENIRNDLDSILGKKKAGRVCTNTRPKISLRK